MAIRSEQRLVERAGVASFGVQLRLICRDASFGAVPRRLLPIVKNICCAVAGSRFFGRDYFTCDIFYVAALGLMALSFFDGLGFFDISGFTHALFI